MTSSFDVSNVLGVPSTRSWFWTTQSDFRTTSPQRCFLQITVIMVYFVIKLLLVASPWSGSQACLVEGVSCFLIFRACSFSLSLYVYIEHSLFCCMACLSYHVVWWLRLVLSPCVELILSILSSCLLLSQFMHQYANMTGVYWWDPCYHSSTMDPSWVMIHDVLDVRPHLLRIGGLSEDHPPKKFDQKLGPAQAV